jgi:hypothetical protein
VGERQAAADAAWEAVNGYEPLAANAPDLYSHELAVALYHLSHRLEERGQPQLALKPAERAVEIHDRLPAEVLAQHLPDYAAANSALGNRLQDLNEHVKAKAYTTVEECALGLGSDWMR